MVEIGDQEALSSEPQARAGDELGRELADLFEDASRQRVVIATPATMLALLQVVQLGWREHALSALADLRAHLP